MKRLLVTGGCGFIGSHFIRQWLARYPDARITNLDKLTYAGNRENLRDLERHPGYALIQGDIADRSTVNAAVQGCEAIVNFAAESHVDRSITDAAPFLQTNYVGVAVLLEAARAHAVTRFLQVSTDEVYGSVAEGAAREDDALCPSSPYAATKAAADLLVQAYHATHGLPTVITRGSNTFGPHQYPEKIIPLFITNLMEGATLPLYGDGQQRRDWLYVQDHVDAIETVLLRGAPGAIYNISGQQELANRELATAILSALGGTEASIERVPDRPGHDRRYAVDGARLAELGWHPRVPFPQALRETVQWYQAHADWWKPLKEQLRADPYHWLNRTARPGLTRQVGVRA